MAIFDDDFTGTDGDLLTARSGWSKFGPGASATLQIAGNKARTTGDDCPFVGQDKGGANHYVQCTLLIDLSGTAGTNPFRLAVRGADRNEMVYAAYSGSEGRWGIYRSSVGRLDSELGTAAIGDVVRLEVEGNMAALFVNGEFLVFVDVSDAATGSAGGTMDDNTVVGIMGDWVDGATANDLVDDWQSGLMSDVGTPALIIGDTTVLVAPDDVSLSVANAAVILPLQDTTIFVFWDDAALFGASAPLMIPDTTILMFSDEASLTGPPPVQPNGLRHAPMLVNPAHLLNR